MKKAKAVVVVAADAPDDDVLALMALIQHGVKESVAKGFAGLSVYAPGLACIKALQEPGDERKLVLKSFCEAVGVMDKLTPAINALVASGKYQIGRISSKGFPQTILPARNEVERTVKAAAALSGWQAKVGKPR